MHEVNTPEQFIEIYARVPGKMIYSENYRFDSAGNYLGTAGYADGHWGKQVVYAMYRLHFGDFAGIPSKLLYFVLGIMLTVLCISGMEIWLAKKANPPLATRLWHCVVWVRWWVGGVGWPILAQIAIVFCTNIFFLITPSDKS